MVQLDKETMLSPWMTMWWAQTIAVHYHFPNGTQMSLTQWTIVPHLTKYFSSDHLKCSILWISEEHFLNWGSIVSVHTLWTRSRIKANQPSSYAILQFTLFVSKWMRNRCSKTATRYNQWLMDRTERQWLLQITKKSWTVSKQSWCIFVRKNSWTLLICIC